MSSGEEELSQDVVFDVLSSRRRREVLYMLKNEGSMELTELTEHVAAKENDTTIEDLTKQQRKRVYVSLYQTHVPKLEEAGLVEYDPDSGEVDLRARATDVERYLEGEDRWHWQYAYFAIAAAGLALVVLSRADVWLFGALSELGVAVIVIATVALTAALHFATWANATRLTRRIGR